ncbi:MAG: acyl carrier protein [Proteobacteria bacterium]|nr:acyl carrier protein [Pseudomonadota bacterium]
MTASTDHKLRRLLGDVLGLKPEQTDGFTADTGLFGHLPELDSMAVAGLLTEMEDRFDIVIDEDEIDADTFETYGSLLAFVKAKREAA